MRLHLHLHLHLHTHLEDVECKLMVENVLLDCAVVHLVGAEPQNSIAPKSGVKVSARVLLLPRLLLRACCSTVRFLARCWSFLHSQILAGGRTSTPHLGLVK